ncbi:GatB/YqeY domain-containing protein [Oceanicoccus sagamiensis]|uniref:Glutamyl-tRNA amidotransferase n=1 Tax=Oceanicoccus sagamiensis TaxID=716816 RepID=A0A1X9ND01_9GAMM|nr:GatB/YqeY domain-containing protein [Oceanicoccus sagamiensis]ARN74292.1 glutamyl-tRNA amidotransferase [Oceanicoccus sagamiensis]
MTEQTLKARIHDEMKAAMRAKDKQRLGTIRLIQAEIKRIEVDERIDIDDARLLAVLDKMCKQRRDSIQQYTDAGRTELADVEVAEINVIQDFLPAQLSEAELASMIADAVAGTGAESMKDMGKVMGILKPKLQGRADMGEVSKLIKSQLS